MDRLITDGFQTIISAVHPPGVFIDVPLLNVKLVILLHILQSSYYDMETVSSEVLQIVVNSSFGSITYIPEAFNNNLVFDCEADIETRRNAIRKLLLINSGFHQSQLFGYE